MKNLLNQYPKLIKSKASYAAAISFLLVAVTGCGGAASDSGQIVNQLAMPTGAIESLYCPNVGINDEACVLFDPANVYERSAVTSATKFGLSDDATSSKARFYLWATAQARDPQGENQYLVAENLHRNFSEEGSTIARDQAIRAYRSVLDNFYDSKFFTGPVGNQTANPLKDWSAGRIVNPGDAQLPLLFDTRSDALKAIDDWGYLYDFNTKTISKKAN
ncbi:MAG: hypothetical protein ACPG47_06430 [Leucothrix sp.]